MEQDPKSLRSGSDEPPAVERTQRIVLPEGGLGAAPPATGDAPPPPPAPPPSVGEEPTPVSGVLPRIDLAPSDDPAPSDDRDTPTGPLPEIDENAATSIYKIPKAPPGSAAASPVEEEEELPSAFSLKPAGDAITGATGAATRNVRKRKNVVWVAAGAALGLALGAAGVVAGVSPLSPFLSSSRVRAERFVGARSGLKPTADDKEGLAHSSGLYLVHQFANGEHELLLVPAPTADAPDAAPVPVSRARNPPEDYGIAWPPDASDATWPGEPVVAAWVEVEGESKRVAWRTIAADAPAADPPPPDGFAAQPVEAGRNEDFAYDPAALPEWNRPGLRSFAWAVRDRSEAAVRIFFPDEPGRVAALPIASEAGPVAAPFAFFDARISRCRMLVVCGREALLAEFDPDGVAAPAIVGDPVAAFDSSISSGAAPMAEIVPIFGEGDRRAWLVARADAWAEIEADDAGGIRLARKGRLPGRGGPVSVVAFPGGRGVDRAIVFGEAGAAWIEGGESGEIPLPPGFKRFLPGPAAADLDADGFWDALAIDEEGAVLRIDGAGGRAEALQVGGDAPLPAARVSGYPAVRWRVGESAIEGIYFGEDGSPVRVAIALDEEAARSARADRHWRYGSRLLP